MKVINQKGFTLVELLVAAALGIVLLSIVVAIFFSSRTAQRVAQGVSESQEATRFSMHFLKRDIRLAGYKDCAANQVYSHVALDDDKDTMPLSVDTGIFGWEFAGTDVGDTYTLDYDEPDSNSPTANEVETIRTANTANANSWTGDYIRGIPGTPQERDLPATIAGFSPLAGSDIISISISEQQKMGIQRPFNQINAVLNTVTTFGSATNPASLFEPAATVSGLQQGQILQVGDCEGVQIFQNSAEETDDFISIGSGGDPGNILEGFTWPKLFDEHSNVYATTTRVYFVGTGAAGIPSLFVYESDCGFNLNCGASQVALVSGVENMQILYLLRDPSSGVNQFVSADDVNDFRDVRAVKLSLLIRSIESSLDAPLDQTFNLNDEIAIEVPEDTNQHSMTTTTVYLQNRGL